ncbi:MAG: UDP-N-acetylmuramoyl-L-alanine--D-glutamate ligase [Peptococcaceae bacterium]|nr:UDP-N-acetylmuramoyl-L-alanine--D-glutamate ligase [Peptococcaceae bacterium]
MDGYHMKVVVIGAGMSGAAAAKLLHGRGALVYIMDGKDESGLPYARELPLPQERRLFGAEMTLSSVPGPPPDLVVLSPGVPPHLKVVQEALNQEIRVWSEVELALGELMEEEGEDADDSKNGGHRATVIGVTGSNGKTTTASLLGAVAAMTGKSSVVAGNIGRALTSLIEEYEYIVAELSSFQLAFLDKLRIPIAVLLNITPDHLDWHGSFEAYVAAKARIFKNQRPEDVCVINWECPVCREISETVSSRRVFFSSGTLLFEGWGLEQGWIVRRRDGKSRRVVETQALSLKGVHNWENVMAALAVAEELGLSEEEMSRVVTAFEPVKHRQEVVGTFDGILYINDSKATNPDSAIKAMGSYENPIVLLAGGRNKGLDMMGFMKVAKERARCVVVYGEAAAEMQRAGEGVGVPRIVERKGFAEAVAAAIEEACPGDVVLLSPGCTSWDGFKNYEERGECFKELVRAHYDVK